MNLAQKLDTLADRVIAIVSKPLMLWCVALLVVGFKLTALASPDPDLFARVAMGRLVISQNAVPRIDPFSFTPVLPKWIDHEWLSGLVFYLVSQGLGDTGLVLLKLGLAFATITCVLGISFRYFPLQPARSLWIIICLLQGAAAWTSTIRCQAFTYLFIPLLFAAILEYRTFGRKFLLALSPLLAIPWANMHGGYTLGLVILVALIITSPKERWFPIAVLVAWCSAPAFTPYGFRAFSGYLLKALRMERPGILEWLPLWSDPFNCILTLSIALPVVLGILRRPSARDNFGCFVMAIAGYCALRHIRFIPFFMISIACLGAPYVDETFKVLRNRFPTIIAKLCRAGAIALTPLLVLVALLTFCNLIRKDTYRFHYTSMPIAAIEWLRTSGLHGNLLVDFNHGSLALWRLYPRFKVSVDGRYEETYPEQTVRDSSLAFYPTTPEGAKALARLSPQYILLPKALAPNGLENTFSAPWKILYRDDTAAVLTREQTGIQPITIESDPLFSPKDPWTPLF